jgi:hypothetical protein
MLLTLIPLLKQLRKSIKGGLDGIAGVAINESNIKVIRLASGLLPVMSLLQNKQARGLWTLSRLFTLSTPIGD